MLKRQLLQYFNSLVIILCLFSVSKSHSEELKDLNYGAILYEFYQQDYFKALVEYEYADEKGGIENHGDYPELLKGGISFSYGMERQARDIFDRALKGNLPENARNRVWFHVAKMAYRNGDVSVSAKALANITGDIEANLLAEYLYISSIVWVQKGRYQDVVDLQQVFDSKDIYAPYIYFNRAIAHAQLGDIKKAIAHFTAVSQYASNNEYKALGDRANLALSYLYESGSNESKAKKVLEKVRSSGFFSNQALLTYAWLAINEKDYKKSLVPLKALTQRSIAIPEVQEAILLLPHVYEKLQLKGRAQRGFIEAGNDYETAILTIQKLRQGLKNTKNLKKFTAAIALIEEGKLSEPSQELSPFLLSLISDHTFQSVLGELQDLQELKASLEAIKAKEIPLYVILSARQESKGKTGHTTVMSNLIKRKNKFKKQYAIIKKKFAAIGDDYSYEDMQRLKVNMDYVRDELDNIEQTLATIGESKKHSNTVRQYRKRIKKRMSQAKRNIVTNDMLLKKVEKILYRLIKDELDLHEKRFDYYLTQSRLAKARLYDSLLQDIDPFQDEKLSSESQ